ncbi:NTP transferase domain-containing protein [Lipingzhangella sp. LS1_29]|uniref:NTP transferase domain-containing protein n=1 Tax=Lipingzhangella rawalii TaxID=2055835 RepID=A0ABU2H0R1_9ACTN|nr:NTP transferase domain-containing protein [Lipingzhangella rawalii]MDS1268887.1 NTP transferase domain-containing protein [Lipingzhangella rawalii]
MPAEPATVDEAFDAVILAGGAARRLGGVDKLELSVGGATLLEHVTAAVVHAEQVIVVGPPRTRPPARYVREEPPGSGPVPALRTGMRLVCSPRVVLLAGDMPLLGAQTVERLRRERRARAAAGAVLLDSQERHQWLAGVWDSGSLSAALADYAGSSLHGLLAPLHPVLVREAESTSLDCDTPADLELVRRLASTGSEQQDPQHGRARRGDG